MPSVFIRNPRVIGLSWVVLALAVAPLVWGEDRVYAGTEDRAISEKPALLDQAPGTYYRVSRDLPLIHAMQLLVACGESAKVDYILKTPIRLVIKPLETLNPALKTYDAVSWLSPDGQAYVFVSDRHRQAPPEALAALLGHEVIHSDESNSIAEEIYGWSEEARLWKKLRPLVTIPDPVPPLIKRLDRIVAEQRQGTLIDFVRHNPGYAKLPEHSPGY